MLSRITMTLASAVMITGTQNAVAAADDWSFKIVPYAWLSGLNGDVATLPGSPPASIDLSFGDVLENLDIGGFVAGEATYGDLFFLGELSYASISASAQTPGPFFTGGEVKAQTFQGALAAGYTVDRGPTHEIGVFAGFRAWIVDTELRLNGGRVPVVVQDRESFIDPIIGARASYRFAPDWSVAASASIGGFGVGADFEWSTVVGLTYHAGESWGVTAGYRYMSVDYSSGGYLYDVDQHGPFVGFVFEF